MLKIQRKFHIFVSACTCAVVLYLSIYYFNSQSKSPLFGASLVTYELHTAVDTKRAMKYFFVPLYPQEKHRVMLSVSDDAGYANRMYGVISALLIAQLTQRNCWISYDGLDDFIDLPYVTEYFELTAIGNSGSGSSWAISRDPKSLMTTTVDNTTQMLKVTKSEAFFFDVCSNPSYFDRLVHGQLVNGNTIRNALATLNGNVSDDVKLDCLLQVGFEVAGNLLKRYWPLKPIMIDLIGSYTSKYYGPSFRSFIIGIHLRSQFIDQTSDIEKFINCAMEIESAQRGQEWFNPFGLNKVKWLVVSDSQKLVDDIIRQHSNPNRLIFTTNGTSINIHNLKDPVAYKQGAQKTLLDLELLSLCDEIIVTGGSTYGFLAAIKAQKMPYYAIQHQQANESQRNCERMRLSRPSSRRENNLVFAVFK